MKILVSYLLLAFSYTICHAVSLSAAYWELQYEYGAINAGTAGTFSTTNFSNFIVDHNPSLIVFSEPFLSSYSNQPHEVILKSIHKYKSLSTKYKKIGFGLSERQYYLNEDTFVHNSRAVSLSISYMISDRSSIGLNFKSIKGEIGSAKAQNYAFGIGLARIKLLEKLTYSNYNIFGNINYFRSLMKNLALNPTAFEGVSIGLSIRNLGPHVVFFERSQGDPLPQSFHLGIAYTPVKTNLISITTGYEFERDLISAYPDMDWDNDGIVGGYDSTGKMSIRDADYNSKGQRETAHTDSWFRAIFTSWIDDWLLGGDIDKPGKDGMNDGIIGGYTIDDNGNIIRTEVQWGESEYGKYNDAGILEVGTGDDRTFIEEWESSTHYFGIEISMLGLFGYKVGNLYSIAGGTDTKSWGYYIGPDFLRYHYAELHEVGERYIENTQKFHTIEVNYSGNLEGLLEYVLE